MKRTVGGDFVHGSVVIGNDEPPRYAAYAQTRLGQSNRMMVAQVELPAEAPADDASYDDGEEHWSASQAPTGAEIDHAEEARATRSRRMPRAPGAGGLALARCTKAMDIKKTTAPYLCEVSIKRVLLEALQIEAGRAEVVEYPVRSEQGVYSDLVCAAEAFLAALIGQWEAQISLKKPRPRTMLAGDVQLALGILY